MTLFTGYSDEIHRGNCGFFDVSESAHCLVFSDQKYASYEIVDF